jgi:hypothetical protein
MRYLLKRYYVIIAVECRDGKGDRHCPLLHRIYAGYFIS